MDMMRKLARQSDFLWCLTKDIHCLIPILCLNISILIYCEFSLTWLPHPVSLRSQMNPANSSDFENEGTNKPISKVKFCLLPSPQERDNVAHDDHNVPGKFQKISVDKSMKLMPRNRSSPVQIGLDYVSHCLFVCQERAFAEWLVCTLVLHLTVINFIGW